MDHHAAVVMIVVLFIAACFAAALGLDLEEFPHNSRSCSVIPGCCNRHPDDYTCSSQDHNSRRLAVTTGSEIMQMRKDLDSGRTTPRKGNANRVRKELDKKLLDESGRDNGGEIQKGWREKARARVAEDTRRIQLVDYQKWSKENARPCKSEQRVGGGGDGGKWVCLEHIPAPEQKCTVLSIGSGHDFSFEIEVHTRWPHCSIHVFDGTNFGRGAPKNTPQFVNFHLVNFHGRRSPDLDEALRDSSQVDILKIDCEGCEFYALMPFLARVRVKQVLVELHGCLHRAYGKNQHLMRMLSGMFGIFHVEPNYQHSDGTCVEFSMIRLPQNATTSTAYALA